MSTITEPAAEAVAAEDIKVASDAGDLIKWWARNGASGGADVVGANNRTYSVEGAYPYSCSVSVTPAPSSIRR